ncbi:AraC family transcriptional regulator [Candidatus Contubernalis alkaliaceticus]|uniref:AraC family transcriptional regulator n=1 Tax=Candidatus Contubernalis alkaliaceticus TaxID=338645 RepID=UPI001F4C50B0|nr:helix-turn-helix domain-containing protein [Candidatus Contubernalis alkalaceticus]UNC91185.1 helix-turn-helix transcriptional regulator [Candidatus Contubernalis alkalaceticus]
MSRINMGKKPLPDFVKEDEFISSYPGNKMTIFKTKKPIYLLKGEYKHLNYEFIITDSSVDDFMIDGKKIYAEPGMIFAINSEQMHGTKYLSKVSFLSIQFEREFLQDLALRIYGIKQVVFLSLPIPVDQEIPELVNAFIQEHKQKQEGYFYILNNLSVHIAIAVFRKIGIVNYTCEKKEDEKKKIQQIVEYLNQNYDDDISLDKISDISNMSKFNLIRKFKESTGMTPHEYLLNIRIMRALEFLSNPKNKIIDAGVLSGFENQSYFSRIFKTKTGLTPSEYRKKVLDI